MCCVNASARSTAHSSMNGLLFLGIGLVIPAAVRLTEIKCYLASGSKASFNEPGRLIFGAGVSL